MRTTLSLRREALTDLTPVELIGVLGGAASGYRTCTCTLTEIEVDPDVTRTFSLLCWPTGG